MSIQTWAEALTLQAVMALPTRVQRLLAGPPVELDGQRLAVDTQLMLRLQQVARIPAVETLAVEAGRLAMDHQALMAGGRLPVGAVRDLDVADLPARLYSPLSASSATAPMPLLVFLHGGGFVFGGLDSHDAPCRLIAERAGCRVLSVDYRLGPEHEFPAAYDDAVDAYAWVVEHAASLGADPERLAVGGDSAGGNLAAGVAIEAARRGLPLALQLLLYPATDNARATRSLELFAEGFFLTRRFIDLATESYTPDESTRLDPRCSPAYADLPEGLAPAYVVTAGFDPLRDEGEAYAWRLERAGVDVKLSRFPDQIHGFLNVLVSRRSRAAVVEIASEVKSRLA